MRVGVDVHPDWRYLTPRLTPCDLLRVVTVGDRVGGVLVVFRAVVGVEESVGLDLEEVGEGSP